MKIRSLTVAIMISALVFSVIPVNYALAGEVDGIGITATGIGGGEVDVDEPAVEAPATENEHLISDSIEKINENGPTLYAVRQKLLFERPTQHKVKFSITMTGSAGTTKLVSKVYLMRRSGNTYKYTGKKATKSFESKSAIHLGSFSVEKDSKYKIKVVTIEHKDKKSYTKSPIYSIAV